MSDEFERSASYFDTRIEEIEKEIIKAFAEWGEALAIASDFTFGAAEPGSDSRTHHEWRALNE